MLNGIDVSSWQNTSSIKACGPQHFAICKASEGIGYKDPKHDTLVAYARKQHMLVGHYDFAWPLNNPESEAAWFLKCARPRPGDLLCLDLEKQQGSELTRLDFAIRWGAYIRSHTGASPVLYSYPNYLQGVVASGDVGSLAKLRTMPLWMATADIPSGTVPSSAMCGWPEWTMHQYSAGPHADRDVLNGDASTWAKLAIPGATHAPKPTPPVVKPPTPTPAPVWHAILETNQLTEDGVFGVDSCRALMRFAADGIITSQPQSCATFNPALTSARYVPDAEAVGCEPVRWLQHRYGVTPADGKWGAETNRGIQTGNGLHADGIFGPRTARALQADLNNDTIGKK